tara:strand:+ start:8152 stop:8445 length:294 start_codon:yes stop_codon:yes gene_type:complete
MNKLIYLQIVILFSCASGFLYAEEKANTDSKIITIETATIRGNQELPTVLYLVPWQAPKINSLNATQTTDLTKNTIELIDRSSFKRLIEYYVSFKYP